MKWNNNNLFKKRKRIDMDKFPVELFYTQEKINEESFDLPIKPDRNGIYHAILKA